MTELNFDFEIKDLDGKAIQENGKPVKAKSLLSTFLANQTKGDPIKMWEQAQAIHKTGKVKMDTSDRIAFKELVKQSDFTTIVKAQILEVIKD